MRKALKQHLLKINKDIDKAQEAYFKDYDDVQIQFQEVSTNLADVRGDTARFWRFIKKELEKKKIERLIKLRRLKSA